MSDASAKRPPPEPPPTIGYLREHGIVGFLLLCSGPNCQRSANLRFDQLGLPDNTPFIEVATRRRWICMRCGSRKANVMPAWPYRSHEMPRRSVCRKCGRRLTIKSSELRKIDVMPRQPAR